MASLFTLLEYESDDPRIGPFVLSPISGVVDNTLDGLPVPLKAVGERK